MDHEQATRAPRDRFSAVAGDTTRDLPGRRTFTTSDPRAIRQWAERHNAGPATGEATSSGPRVRDVNDGGVGIRFNFPGFAPFRPISWEEWLDHFRTHELLLVYEEQDERQVADRAQARWHARGEPEGDDWDDWFAAERDLLLTAEGQPPLRYRLIKRRDLV
ncbi:MAG: DUF2934 domain-containing protein [Vicinamibacterales bacterium]